MSKSLIAAGWVKVGRLWVLGDSNPVSLPHAEAIQSKKFNHDLWTAGEILYPKKRGKWQSAMADNYSISRVTISNWLWGVYNPRSPVYRKIMADAKIEPKKLKWDFRDEDGK